MLLSIRPVVEQEHTDPDSIGGSGGGAMGLVQGTAGQAENLVGGDTISNIFGLSEAEKTSIEADIIAGKPIMATPAYLKFLSAFLPNGLKAEDKDGKLVFSIDTPEYEVYRGSIRANYAGAVVIIERGLSSLFDRPVRLATSEEFFARVAEHKHYAGYRSALDGKSRDVDKVGYGWVEGVADDGVAPCAWRDANGNSYSRMGNRQGGLSLFPSFR